MHRLLLTRSVIDEAAYLSEDLGATWEQIPMR